jgi:NADH:ubiquinone oxidoreductase subunit 5 (subunit L)/multisubunit Na+/H+ antiporter MnhA subunit
LSLLGLITAFFALIVGLMQREPKVILAYSSMSKMGFLLLLIGLMLGQPELAGLGVVAVVFYAAHHALCKAGLFLGLGLHEIMGACASSGASATALGCEPKAKRARSWVFAGLSLLALALAGAPLTSGAVAKYLTKPLLVDLPWDWSQNWSQNWSRDWSGNWLDPLLWLMALSSMLLMARFLWLLWSASSLPVVTGARRDAGAGHAAGDQSATASRLPPLITNPIPATPLLAWSLLVVVVLLLPWRFGPAASWLTNAATLGVALGLCLGVLYLARKGRNPLMNLVGRVPPGDMLPWALGGARALGSAGWWLWRLWHHGVASVGARLARGFGVGQGSGATTTPNPAPGRAGQTDLGRRTLSKGSIESELRAWPVAGALWLGLGTLLLFLLIMGGMG